MYHYILVCNNILVLILTKYNKICPQSHFLKYENRKTKMFQKVFFLFNVQDTQISESNIPLVYVDGTEVEGCKNPDTSVIGQRKLQKGL